MSGSDSLDTALLERIADVEVSIGKSSFTLQGVEPGAARAVVRSEQRSPVPAAGRVVLSPSAADLLGAATGEPVELTGASGAESLTAPVAPDTEQFATTTRADAQRLDAAASTSQAWVRLDDLGDAREGDVVDEITDVVTATLPASDASGIVAVRASFDQILTTMLLVVTGLLAVAVLIALIGVGDTLALTVLERPQESGLLRALGLTRGQLQALSAWEALLVAGVAAVLGVVLGTGYGLVGTASILSAEAPVVLDVPWGPVAGIVVVAAGAGVLASVLPGRRAARTSPVAALAD